MTSSSLALWAEEAEAAAGIARALAGTAFIPDSLKVFDPKQGFDLDATVAQVTAALLTGQELGMPPMASLRSIDVIPPGSGSPALRAAAQRALLQQHGHDIWVAETTDTRAIVRGVRAGTDVIQESVWTIDRASKLQLRSFNDPKGQWKRQPASMLVARATGECARWIASDVLLGLPLAEELEYDPSEDGAGAQPVPIEDGTRPAPPKGRTVRKSRRRTSLAPVAALPAASSPVPGAPSAGDSTPEGDAAEVAAAAPARIEARQRTALWAGLKDLGLVQRDEALAAVSKWAGREITSSNALTKDEASIVLDAIQAEKERRTARAAADDQDAQAEAPQEGPPDAS